MTFRDKDYEVTVIATLPDPTIDSFTATKVWLREYAMTKREAARYNDSVGWPLAAEALRADANRIHEALEVLEGKHEKRK